MNKEYIFPKAHYTSEIIILLLIGKTSGFSQSSSKKKGARIKVTRKSVSRSHCHYQWAEQASSSRTGNGTESIVQLHHSVPLGFVDAAKVTDAWSSNLQMIYLPWSHQLCWAELAVFLGAWKMTWILPIFIWAARQTCKLQLQLQGVRLQSHKSVLCSAAEGCLWSTQGACCYGKPRSLLCTCGYSFLSSWKSHEIYLQEGMMVVDQSVFHPCSCIC